MHLYPHEPIGDVIARIREEQLAMHIDTTTSTIRNHAGGKVLAYYRLEKKRRWNIGLRRHAWELTGRIEVSHNWSDGHSEVATFDNWTDVKQHVKGMK